MGTDNRVTDSEEHGIARGSGKWAKAGVPRKGWTCTSMEDLGAPDAVCEMCENQDIRYVHYMEHPEYPGVLGVGCVCAGHMERDYEGARKRETQYRNVAQRRSRWLARRWRTSAKGNLYLRTDGFNITLFRKDAHWSGAITERATDRTVFAKRSYETLDQAKLAAFDAMIRMKGR